MNCMRSYISKRANIIFDVLYKCKCYKINQNISKLNLSHLKIGNFYSSHFLLFTVRWFKKKYFKESSAVERNKNIKKQ